MSNESNNAPAVPDETIAAMWSLYAGTNTVMRLERSQFAHLVRIVAKKLIAATPAPAPAVPQSRYCLEISDKPGCRYKAAGGGLCDHCATPAPAPAQEVVLTDDEILRVVFPKTYRHLTNYKRAWCLHLVRACLEALRAKKVKG
jgi:hypothetical protein